MCNLSSMIAEENQQIGKIICEDSKSREMSIYLYNHGVPLELIANAANTAVEQIQKWISADIQNHKDLS